ncbi:MAG: AI-2E family transporter [Chloroflexota bacterium]
MNSRRWTNSTKILVASSLVILAIVLLITFRAMISPTIVAFLLAFILSYPVNWIQKQTGWPRVAVVAGIYVTLIASAALAPALVLPRILELPASLQQALEELIADLQSASTGSLFRFGNFSYDLSVDRLFDDIGTGLQQILLFASRNPLSIARGVTTGILTIIYVLVLNFWLLKDWQKFQRVLIELLPSDYQEDARRLGQQLGTVWNAFLRGQILLGTVVGTVTWIALSIVGMPNAGGLALLAGLMEFLPTVGPGFSTTIAAALALFQGSTWIPITNLTFMMIVIFIYAVIGQVETTYLIPRLVGGRVQLHPAVTFVGIINGAIVFGVLGVLLATPIMASVRVILIYISRKMSDLEPFEAIGQSQSAVRIPGLIAGRKIEAIVFDLDGTLVNIEWQFAENIAQRMTWLDPILSMQQRTQLVRRFMVGSEGLINFTISQLQRLQLNQDLERVLPLFNGLRGYPHVQQMKLVPGIKDTILTLSKEYRLALFSTRERSDVEQGLAHAGLDISMFNTIMTRNDVRNIVPHSEPLLSTADQLDVNVSNMLVVSDTDSNLRSASAAEMVTVGVLYGLGREQDMQHADVVIYTADELSEWL